MNITVNLSAFAADLDQAAGRLLANMERGVAEGAAQVERAAKRNLKGDARGKHLMGSIHSEVESNGTVVTAKIGVGGATGIDGDAGENFGIYVHEGTGIYGNGAGRGQSHGTVPWPFKDDQGQEHWTYGMEANPFLENAYNSESGKVARIVAKALTGGM
jgi:HK97 gp10 family phage protein